MEGRQYPRSTWRSLILTLIRFSGQVVTLHALFPCRLLLELAPLVIARDLDVLKPLPLGSDDWCRP